MSIEKTDVTRNTFEELEETFVQCVTEIRAEGVRCGVSCAPLAVEVRPWILLCLNLFNAGSYRFSKISPAVIVWLGLRIDTITELQLLCAVLSDPLRVGAIGLLQGMYDKSVADSPAEQTFGRLLQVLTGIQPRKIGPQKDWLGGA